MAHCLCGWKDKRRQRTAVTGGITGVTVNSTNHKSDFSSMCYARLGICKANLRAKPGPRGQATINRGRTLPVMLAVRQIPLVAPVVDIRGSIWPNRTVHAKAT